MRYVLGMIFKSLWGGLFSRSQITYNITGDNQSPSKVFIDDGGLVNVVISVLRQQLSLFPTSSGEAGACGSLKELNLSISNSNLGSSYELDFTEGWIFEDGIFKKPYIYKGFIPFVKDYKMELTYAAAGGAAGALIIVGTYIYVLPVAYSYSTQLVFWGRYMVARQRFYFFGQTSLEFLNSGTGSVPRFLPSSTASQAAGVNYFPSFPICLKDLLT